MIFLYIFLELYFHPVDIGFIFLTFLVDYRHKMPKNKSGVPLHPTHTSIDINDLGPPSNSVVFFFFFNVMLGDIAGVTTQIHLDILTFQTRYVLAFLFNLPTFQRTYIRLSCRLGKERERKRERERFFYIYMCIHKSTSKGFVACSLSICAYNIQSLHFSRHYMIFNIAI